MVNERRILREIVDEVGLEEVLLSSGIDPVEALVILYEAGEFDLERLVSSYEELEEEEEDSD